ncbi:MAG: DHHA1 domain-containing protein [Thermoplasmatota archaeon]
MTDNLLKLCEKSSKIIQSFPRSTRIRVVSHYDADGISSAAIICKALYRSGYDFHVSIMRNPFNKGLERLSKEQNQLIIFCDMGSAQIETIESLDCRSIIIDHHQFLKEKTSENVLQINANLCELNGNYEACGSTLTYSVVKTLNPKNIDLISLAMAGATGDKQYIGGFNGYNKTILEEALKNGFLKENISIKLYGETLQESLYLSIDPYYPGLSGNNDEINELLKKLKLTKNSKIEDLNEEQKKKLNSFLIFKLIKAGCEKNILDTVIRNRYYSDDLGCELERFADLLDSCGKGGDRGLALTFCMGDKKAFEEALNFEKEYRQRILNELTILEKEGVKEMKNLRYFYIKNSSLGGVVSGIATNYVFDKEKPLFSISKDEKEIHVSCRANQYLVSKGLDLGFAMKEAADKLEGFGGGHKIAAGATINSEKEEEFLEIVDKIIGSQFK